MIPPSFRNKRFDPVPRASSHQENFWFYFELIGCFWLGTRRAAEERRKMDTGDAIKGTSAACGAQTEMVCGEGTEKTENHPCGGKKQLLGTRLQ